MTINIDFLFLGNNDGYFEPRANRLKEDEEKMYGVDDTNEDEDEDEDLTVSYTIVINGKKGLEFRTLEGLKLWNEKYGTKNMDYSWVMNCLD